MFLHWVVALSLVTTVTPRNLYKILSKPLSTHRHQWTQKNNACSMKLSSPCRGTRVREIARSRLLSLARYFAS